MNIYPTILTGSLTTAQHQLDLVKASPLTVVQIDVIDGLYADNVTITPADAATLDFGDLSIDFHFLTEEPLDYVYECIEFAEMLPIRAMIAQIEKMSYQHDYIEDVKKMGWQVGMSLEMFTSVTEVDDRTWSALDIIQLMAVESGSQGQTLQTAIFPQLTAVMAELQQRQIQPEVVVDGGIKNSNFQQLVEAGASGLVVGSAIWRHPNPDQALTEWSQHI